MDLKNLPLKDLAIGFVDQLPHSRRLKTKVLEASNQHVLLELPYNTELIGYPNTGVIHGGVITTLMDTASGCAVICRIVDKHHAPELSPTLDLRVDYMKAALPNKSIYCFAQCYKLSSSIAFTKAISYQDDIDDPIAHAVGTFMRIGTEITAESLIQGLIGDTK